MTDLLTEPDSFIRQRKALLRLAQALKRVPTLDEALEFIKVNKLYSGSWENSNRRVRVKGILKYIARTFDAKKCARRSESKATVNVGKYDAWATKKFPNGFVGGSKKFVDEQGEVVEINQNIRVGPDFLAVFMSVVEFMLLLDQNEDNSVPHERAKELWTCLYDNGQVAVKFDGRKWAVCREAMVRFGIVVITDRNYCHDKAMRWAVGVYFPLLGLWKIEKHSSLFGVDGSIKSLTTTGQHNSLLQQQSIFLTDFDQIATARPPPIFNSG